MKVINLSFWRWQFLKFQYNKYNIKFTILQYTVPGRSTCIVVQPSTSKSFSSSPSETLYPWNTNCRLYFKNFCVCAQFLSHVQFFATPWTVAHQAPLSIGFPRQEYWTGLPFPSPEDLPTPGIEPTSLASPILAGRFFTAVPPKNTLYWF